MIHIKTDLKSILVLLEHNYLKKTARILSQIFRNPLENGSRLIEKQEAVP